MNANLLRVVTETLTTLKNESGNSDIRVPAVLILLFVALRKEVAMTELVGLVGVTQAAISKNLTALGRGSRSEPGLGLVETYEDDYDRKRKLVSLTKKGADLIAKVEANAGKFFHTK